MSAKTYIEPQTTLTVYDECDLLVVGGADLLDGTPIFDIKRYIPYCDCQPEALGGLTQEAGE